MKHVDVESSQVKSVGYDANSKTMEVTFKNGGTYIYSGVSAGDHMRLMAAKSIGGHLSSSIKGKFKFEKKGAKK